MISHSMLFSAISWNHRSLCTAHTADNDTNSSVIKSTNRSRVPSSKPRTDVRPKDKDTRSNPEYKLEQKRWVSTPCSVTTSCDPTGMLWQVHSPWRNMHTMWAILPMKMSILLEYSIKHGVFLCGSLMLQLSNLRVKASVSLVKHWSRKVSF